MRENWSSDTDGVPTTRSSVDLKVFIHNLLERIEIFTEMQMFKSWYTDSHFSSVHLQLDVTKSRVVCPKSSLIRDSKNQSSGK
jgi:hypothetical protein